jgi:hypothetical protein
VNRRRLSEIKQRRTGLTVESRVAVWWPDSPEPQDCDVIIKVTYAPLEPESVKNPAALRAADAVEAER